MQIQNNATLLFQVRTVLLISDFGPWLHEERETQFLKVFANHTIWLHPNARGTLWCLKSPFISTGLDSKNLTAAATVDNSNRCLNRQKLNSLPSLSNLIYADNLQKRSPITTVFFAKFSNSLDHLFRAWRHPHSTPISCLGFCMTMVIVISFARERKTAPNDYVPELRR